MKRAPFGKILPVFAPVLLERGLPGYFASELTEGERRLTESELRALLIGSALIGVDALAIEKKFDHARVVACLMRSVYGLEDLSPEEQLKCLELVQAFHGYPIIRADNAFDDWVGEAMWGVLQTAPYRYPSAMSEAVAFGLQIIGPLQECALEYDTE